MVNVEMVRMSALDKKLSNPSKPSGKKTADFSRLISEKTADVKDAGAPQPDGKVQEKENCGKTEPEDKTDADADDLQAMQLCQDFAARLEWEISQPVPAYEEPSSEQKIQALDMNPEEILQSEAAESENAARVPAESQPVLEKLPEAGKTSKETTEEKTPENFEMQKSEFSHQITEKIPEAERKKTDSGQIEQAGPRSEEETPKQVQLASSAESNIRTESRVFQTVRPAETVRTTRQELSADVGKTIASRMPLKNGEMVIELEPANLGKIIVRATYDAGRATVALMSANVKTLEILSRDAGTIAGMIEEKTGQETVVFVPKQEEYPEESGKERGSNGREPKQQNDRKKQQSESFLQQIRLGLV